MDTIKDLDLIDLISERHIQLRKRIDEIWKETNEIYLSTSEWFILARINQQGETTISYVTKHVNITRQATHKFIKKLKENGLVETWELPNNKKEKGIRLTELGKEYYKKYKSIKEKIEENIADRIGEEQLVKLKEFLRTDWEL